MTQEALKMALEALEFYYGQHGEESDAKAITAIKEALAQKQEPIAMLFGSLPVYDYTTPPQRSEASGKPSAWVGLTDEEKFEICMHSIQNMGANFQETLCKAIEAKLKEKNT
jgi:hypothetical protein